MSSPICCGLLTLQKGCGIATCVYIVFLAFNIYLCCSFLEDELITSMILLKIWFMISATVMLILGACQQERAFILTAAVFTAGMFATEIFTSCVGFDRILTKCLALWMVLPVLMEHMLLTYIIILQLRFARFLRKGTKKDESSTAKT